MRTICRWVLAALTSLAFSTGCVSSDERPAAPARDASMTPDAGVADSGLLDAGLVPDAGESDASVPDAGPLTFVEGRALLWAREDHSGIRVEARGEPTRFAETDSTGAWRLELPLGVHQLEFSSGTYVPALVGDVEVVDQAPVPVSDVTLRLGRRISADPSAYVVLFSPDETKVVFTGNCVSPDSCELWLWDDVRGEATLLGDEVAPASSAAREIRFSADGGDLLFMAPTGEYPSGGTLRRFDVESASIEWIADDVQSLEWSPDETLVRFTAGNAEGTRDLVVWELGGGGAHPLCTNASLHYWMNADWSRALCVSKTDAALRRWDLRTWTVSELGTGVADVIDWNEEATWILFGEGCDVATEACTLSVWRADPEAHTVLSAGVAFRTVQVSDGGARVAFLRDFTEVDYVYRGELAVADATTGAVTTIDSDVGKLSFSPDGSRLLYLRGYDGHHGTLWAWDGADGDKRQVATSVLFDFEIGGTGEWGYYRPLPNSIYWSDLHAWDFRARAATVLATYGAPKLPSEDGVSLAFYDRLDQGDAGATLKVWDSSSGETFVLGTGVGRCNFGKFETDAAMTRAFFTGACLDYDRPAPDVRAWSRAAGAQALDASEIVSVSPDVTKVAVLGTDAQGRAALSAWSFANPTPAAVASGVLISEWRPIEFTEDWSKARIVGGCSSDPCAYSLLVWDTASDAVATFGSGLSESDPFYLVPDWSAALLISGSPLATVTWSDASGETVVGEEVSNDWSTGQGYVVANDASQALIYTGFDPATGLATLEHVRTGDLVRRTIGTALPVQALASRDWSYALHYSELVDGQPKRGRLWLTPLTASGELEAVPVDDQVTAYSARYPGARAARFAYQTADPGREGLYLVRTR